MPNPSSPGTVYPIPVSDGGTAAAYGKSYRVYLFCGVWSLSNAPVLTAGERLHDMASGHHSCMTSVGVGLLEGSQLPLCSMRALGY